MSPISTASTSPQPPRHGLRKRVQAALATASLVSAGLALAVVPLGANSPVASANGGCTPAAAVLNGNGQYVIDTPGKLASIAGASLSATFVQTADLDLTSCGNWTPIGTFTGSYDGGGNTISNANINITASTQNVGLFSILRGSTVERLTLSSVTVSSTSFMTNYMGALVGWIDGATVSAVTISSGSISSDPSRSIQTGGVAGYVDTSNGSVSLSDITLAASVAVSALEQVGALAGQVNLHSSDSYTISIDSVTSSATVSGSDRVGGLIGYARAQVTSTLSIADVTVNDSTLTGAGFNVGGLIGYTNQHSGSTLIVVHATVYGSTVTNTSENVGGLIGYAIANSGTLDLANVTVANSTVTGTGQDVGGLVGEVLANGATVSATGSNVTNVAVTGADQVGGFMGLVSDDGASSPITFAVSNSLVTGGSVVASAANPLVGSFIGRIDPDDAASTFTVAGSEAPAPNNCGTPGFIGSLGQSEQVTVTCPTPQAGNADNSTVLPPAISDLVTRPVVSPATPTTAPPTTPPATTPSTTTVPPPALVPVPATGGSLPALIPGASQVLIDGRPETVNVFVDNTTDLVLSGDGFELRLAGQCTSACAITTDADGRQVLTLERQGLARVEGIGFKAGTPVYVWLFSEPTYLGELSVNPDGSFSGLVPLGDIAEGGHTLQVNGTSADGKPRTANLGVQVVPQQAPAPGGGELPSTGANTTPVVLTALMLLGLGLVATGRRRRNLR